MTAAQKLSEAQVREGLRLEDEDLDVLRRFSRGDLPRNAAAAMQAIRTRLEYSQPKPSTQVEHSGGLEIQIVKYGVGDDENEE